MAWLLCSAACATTAEPAPPVARPESAVVAAAPVAVEAPPPPAPLTAPAEVQPASPALPAYREAIAAVLSSAARAELEAVPVGQATDEGACHASAFSAVLTDAVARRIAVPAFRALGHEYLTYVKLVRDALPMQAHTAVEWNNFTIASPAIGRCEDPEPTAKQAQWCVRARLGDNIGTAVASGFSPRGTADGAIPLGDGASESWSISLADVVDAAGDLGVPRADVERALLEAYRQMRSKLALPCELLSAQEHSTLVPVVFHVAQVGGAPVLGDAALRGWIEDANAFFEPAAIVFAPEVRALPVEISELRTVRERHALKRFIVPRRINVFIVARILDPVASATTKRASAWQGREPSGLLGGAHIEAAGQEPKTYVILSAQNGDGVSLTHELGHFFGVAHHRDPTNVMSYGAERNHFDDTQLETFGRTLRALVRQDVLDFP